MAEKHRYIIFSNTLVCMECGSKKDLPFKFRMVHKPPCEAFDLTDLTQREYQIAQLLAESKTVKDIATVFACSVKTVETHKYNIFNKLNVHKTTELVRMFITMKLKTALKQEEYHLSMQTQKELADKALGL